jgi:hypothetical protein
LFQNDRDTIIPNSDVQRQMTIGAIWHVASRVGLALPSWDETYELIDDVESMDGSQNTTSELDADGTDGTEPSTLE